MTEILFNLLPLLPLAIMMLFMVSKTASVTKRPEAKEIEAPDIDDLCRLWEIRQTQLKMLDAGILTDEDISICDNENCKECQATQTTVRRNRQLAYRQKEYEKKTVAKRDTWNQNRDDDRSRRGQGVSRRATTQTEQGYTRTLSNGDIISLPPAVPSSALHRVSFTRGGQMHVDWSWRDCDNGRAYGYRQTFDRMSYEIRGGGGAVLKSFGRWEGK